MSKNTKQKKKIKHHLKRMSGWLKELFWPNSYASTRRNNIVGCVAVLSSILFIVTIIALFKVPLPSKVTQESAASNEKPTSIKLLLIFWTVVPPVWFWFDYHILWKPTNQKDIDGFKHSQELSRNIWLAFVVLIAALYFK